MYLCRNLQKFPFKLLKTSIQRRWQSQNVQTTKAFTLRQSRQKLTDEVPIGTFQKKTFSKPTHSCGELRKLNVGERVVLIGWSETARKIRDDLLFLPLRDSHGTTQIVVEGTGNLRQELLQLGAESILSCTGIVRVRPDVSSFNKELATGEVEVVIDGATILNSATPLPFVVSNKRAPPSEDVRLKYRYADLRRDVMQKNLRTRYQITRTVRNYLDSREFMEVETPYLFKSTPEGAKEFLVPLNSSPEYAYALPQSPQQYKQILMASGVEKYYQLAKCFRDESNRSDRQPEFTQIDLESSLVTSRDVMDLIEGMIYAIWKDVGRDLSKLYPNGFPVMDYTEAMNKYGSDKPDLRFDYHIHNLASKQSPIEAIVLPGGMSNSQFNKTLSDLCNQLATIGKIPADSKSVPNLITVKITTENMTNWQDISSKPMTKLQVTESLKPLNVNVGDLIVLYRRPKDDFAGGWSTMGRLRVLLGHLNSIDKEAQKFLWVTNFPLFSPIDADEGFLTKEGYKMKATHHPFTAPHHEDVDLIFTNPLAVRGQHYDLVLNGTELGGGSIRIHEANLQRYILTQILGLDSNQVEADFGHLLNALSHGCPPHGGIALGLDRMVAMICQVPNIREVIAFPKYGGGDLLVGSPTLRK